MMMLTSFTSMMRCAAALAPRLRRAPRFSRYFRSTQSAMSPPRHDDASRDATILAFLLDDALKLLRFCSRPQHISARHAAPARPRSPPRSRSARNGAADARRGDDMILLSQMRDMPAPRLFDILLIGADEVAGLIFSHFPADGAGDRIACARALPKRRFLRAVDAATSFRHHWHIFPDRWPRIFATSLAMITSIVVA